MKTQDTFPGKTYAVTSPNGCTVTTDDGLTLAEIEAGKQGCFVAVSGNVTLSDADAKLTEVFKVAPYQKLRLLGVVGGSTPAWFKALEAELTALLDGSTFELAWMAGEKKLVVHTDRVSDELLAAVKNTAEAAMPEGGTLVQYNHNMEISWRDINKYSACKNVDDMLAVNPDFRTDLTSEGEWVYPLSSLTSSTNVLSNNASLKKANLYMPSVSGWAAKSTLSNCKNLTEAHIFAPNIAGIESMFYSCPKLKKVSGEVKSVIVGHNAFLNSPIEILEIEFSKLDRAERFAASTNGNTSATAPRLNKESALRVLNSIPSFTSGNHPIVLGIHVDHQNDEDVLAAIDNAEAKGWTLTVQWNGTPTSTASTMAMGQLVYAKVGELESPDGTVERVLDWGHYVTNPEGYETFRSLASAYRYFGIPMPAESQPTE
jgi:hypothetical protein